MRSIWKGAISFGLVNIPVKVYPATEDRDIKFHYLHARCRTPIQYRRYCPTCDETVEREDIVRGYEYARGQYVIFTEPELEKIAPVSSHLIELTEFINLAEVDPIYFARPYYLVPDKGGEKAYHLLHRAMADTGKAGIGQVVLRSHESLACLRVYQHCLLMETMVYADEVRSLENFQELRTGVSFHPKELTMATRLIENLSAPFAPEKYSDRYREAITAAIEQKVAGREIEAAPPPGPGKVVDLMEALQASIEQAERRRQARKAAQEQQPTGTS